MKKIHLFILLMISSFLSVRCTSENEKKALDMIAAFYACDVTYSIGTSASTAEGSKKYFEIKLSSGKKWDHLLPQYIASNSALYFYESLNEEEKNNYSHLKISLEKDNKSMEYEFPMADLKTVSVKKQLFVSSQSFIAQRNYEKLMEGFLPEIKNQINQESFFTDLDSLNIEFGEIKGNRLDGFYFFDADVNGNKVRLLNLGGVLIRDKKNEVFDVVVSASEKDAFIYGINLNN